MEWGLIPQNWSAERTAWSGTPVLTLVTIAIFVYAAKTKKD